MFYMAILNITRLILVSLILNNVDGLVIWVISVNLIMKKRENDFCWPFVTHIVILCLTAILSENSLLEWKPCFVQLDVGVKVV